MQSKKYKDYIDYATLVPLALRRVVRDALLKGVDPNGHHFFITYQTNYPGVMMPDYLREQYPQVLKIALQHQYSDLKVDDEKFSVRLFFNGTSEKLVVPLASIIQFYDPFVEFILDFQPVPEAELPKPPEKKQEGNVVQFKPREKK